MPEENKQFYPNQEVVAYPDDLNFPARVVPDKDNQYLMDGEVRIEYYQDGQTFGPYWEDIENVGQAK